MKSALALLRRDVMLAFREGGAIGTALGFYLVVVAITPLALGPDLNLLSRIAPGVLWVALLLASLLSADRIFHNDYEDDALDVLATGPLPLELVAAVKSLAHWVTTGIPLALLQTPWGVRTVANLALRAIPLWPDTHFEVTGARAGFLSGIELHGIRLVAPLGPMTGSIDTLRVRTSSDGMFADAFHWSVTPWGSSSAASGTSAVP